MTNLIAIRRLLLAAGVSLLTLAGPAFAGDPVSLLTSTPPDSGLAEAALQPMPGKIEAVSQKASVDLQGVAKPDAIEMAALYYYANEKQDARVEAEVRRLKRKYPDFVMPKDIFLPPEQRGIDERPLWALYDANDFSGIEAEIRRLQAKSPAWQPSEDFVAKLARRKLRFGLENAAKTKDWIGVIALGAGVDPNAETDIDLLWTLIDAHSANGNLDKAAEIYRAILFREKAPVAKSEIITTIQKATRDFKPDDVRAVMARFSTDPEIATGLAGVQTDLMRGEVAEYNRDETRKEPLPKATIERLVAAAQASAKIADYSLLGWYQLKVENPVEASVWFRKAIAAEPSGEHAKGLYLALVRQERQQEAYELALKYRKDLESDPIFLMNALSERFSKPETGEITADAVKAYSGTILATSNPDHSEILAWYAYNSEQYAAAEAWFVKAVGWKHAPARVKGLALTYARLGDKKALVALYKTFGAEYPDLWDDIKLSRGKPGRKPKKDRPEFLDGIDGQETAAVPKERVVEEEGRVVAEKQAPRPAKTSQGYLAHFEAKRFSQCITALQAMEAAGPLSANESLIKGWCYLGLARLAEARTAFARGLSGAGQVRQDAAYGTALAFLRAKLTDDAEAIISVYPLATARDHEVRAEIYWQRARSAFDREQYQAVLEALNARIAIAQEPVNLSQMRGWAHFKLGHVAQARAVFDRLNMHLDDPAIRRGVAATGAESAAISR